MSRESFLSHNPKTYSANSRILIVGVLLLVGCGKSCDPFATRVLRTPKLPFNVLTPDQVDLLATYTPEKSDPSKPEELWSHLSLSQQIEFGAGTRALDHSCKLRECIQEVLTINGDKGQTAASEEQFNVWVEWQPHSLEIAKEWVPHISVLHAGQFGYQENRDGNPFLGIVMLFDKDHPSTRIRGQFHIGFRSWFGHYHPVNGNIGDRFNYVCYRQWYGVFDSFEPVSQFTIAPLGTATRGTRTEIPPNSLQSTVLDFLRSWYIARDLEAFREYQASDNALHAQIVSEKLRVSPDRMLAGMFQEAFSSATTRSRDISDAVSYPGAWIGTNQLKPESIQHSQDGKPLFAILDPATIPKGSILPVGFQKDDAARFLYQLSHKYPLRVVVYVIRPEAGLHAEVVFSYWIEEANNQWRLAALRGTDW